MLNALSRVAAFALPTAAALMLSVAPVMAQDAPAAADVQPTDVVAVVNGYDITEADLAIVAGDLTQDLQQIPEEERRAFLLTVLIDMRLMADAAEAEGFADDPLFERRVAYMRDQVLRAAFFSEIVQPTVTQEAIEATYNEIIGGFEDQEEVHARHILVETEQEAIDIRAEIEGGLAFQEAAVTYSMDGSASNGGDLGYFTNGMMVAPFEEAAFALAPGEMSEPVESQFGWHLILLEDRRPTTPPPLAQVQQQVAQQVLYTNFSELVNALKADAEISIPDEALAAQVEEQSAP